MSNEVTPTTEGVTEAVEELAEQNAPEVVEEEEVEVVEEGKVEEEVVEEPSTVTTDSLLQELAESGYEMSDELIAKAEAAGINPDTVELRGIKDKARVDEAISKVYEVAGGKEEFTKMQEWAKNGGLTEAEAAEFNEGIVGNSAPMFVRGLKAMYNEANPTKKESVVEEKVVESTRIKGNAKQDGSFHKGFKSLQEMQQHIKYMRKNPSDRDAQRTYDEKMKYSGSLLRR